MMLLFVLIVTPITTHYYLSTLAGGAVGEGDDEGIQTGVNDIDLGIHYGNAASRYKLDHTQEITGSRVADLKVSCWQLAYITNQPLLHESEAVQIYTCADDVYVINCN